MQCVILAGGLGTRMRPTTATIPKALIPVNGVPFAHHQLRLISERGVSSVLYLIGHLGQMIVDELGNGSRFGLDIAYAVESGRLLGTAGALRQAYDAHLLDAQFLLLYGDSYLPIDMAGVLSALDDPAVDGVMTVLHNEGRVEPSNVEYVPPLVVRYKKGVPVGADPRLCYIDYGLSALRREAVVELVDPGVVTDLGLLYSELAVHRRLAGHEVQTRFYEVGSPDGLRALETFLRSGVDAS